MQNLRTSIHNKPYSHFGAFSNKCTKSKKSHLKSDTITYLFSFNGQEKDDEIKGNGNNLEFGARISDPRLGGRFLSLDPKMINYPYLSPYCFASNNPIKLIDKNGEDPFDPRTGTTYIIPLYSGVIWNIPLTQKKAVDISLYASSSNKFLKSFAGTNSFNSSLGDPIWPPVPVTLINSDVANRLINNKFGPSNSLSHLPNSNSFENFRIASQTGTYNFIDNGNALYLFGFKRSSYEIVSVKNNEVSGITKMELSGGEYNVKSTTDISYMAGEIFEKSLPFGLKEIYQKIFVTEKITNYDKQGNVISTEEKKYETERKL